ncbi:AAA family ATPase [uncultured Sulfitobacter sp.]|uniref:AAA family ATPase n=1 Tax=uncultured Sulfitobacter sp. TaxID=191468 RepID=UPI00261E6BAD|nr:AAA family ATPase [uncultured Sulfitobacter sp.]
MPQLSPARASATPSFSISIMRMVLQLIYADAASYRKPLVRFETDNHPIDNDDELMDFPDMDKCTPPVTATSGTAADGLNRAEIAERHAAGHDPFATGSDGSVHHFLRHLPIDRMICAARFAAIFDNSDKATSWMAARAITLLTLPDDQERAVFSDKFPDILEKVANALRCHNIHWDGIAIAALPDVQTSSSTRTRAEFKAKIDSMIAKGESIIVVATHLDDLPVSAKVLCNSVITLPMLTGEMLIKLLRQTHSVTGQVSEREIRDRMPDDAALQRLPMPLLKSSFCAATTFKVADCLSRLSRRVGPAPAAQGPTLDGIYLPPKVDGDMEHLVKDLTLWREGNLDWSDVTSSFLLIGPPGTGKTLLAKALAGSAEIPLIETSYAMCQKAGHQGDFLRTLSEKVEDAIRKAPCVFFCDELDSFSKRSISSRNSGYVVAIVNALLEHLTRLNDTPGIVVLGATNFPENVDPAVIRPGRFDRHLPLDNPSRAGIFRIFKIALGERANNLNIANAADRMVGTSGAQIAAVVRDAQGIARHENADLCNAHFEAALDKVAPKGQSEELYRVAIHEAGHAVIAHVLGLPLPAMVRVTARGGAYVGKLPFASTKQIICDQIAVTLGGRAAEAVILGSVSDGAESDLAQATELAFWARHTCGLYPSNLVSLSTAKLSQLDPLAPLGSVINADLKSHYLVAKGIAESNAKLITHVA